MTNKPRKNKSSTKLLPSVFVYKLAPDGTQYRHKYRTPQEMFSHLFGNKEINYKWERVEETSAKPVGEFTIGPSFPVSCHAAKGKKEKRNKQVRPSKIIP